MFSVVYPTPSKTTPIKTLETTPNKSSKPTPIKTLEPTQIIDIQDDTPKLCLNMIVKNESKVILRLLNSVLPLIDGYCICDTGSTDNTIELIESFMKEHNIPGVIVREPFRDFGYNRTFALNEAAKVPNMDYLLLLDADMILTGGALTDPKNFKKLLTGDVYHMCQGSPTYYYKNVRILKNYKGYSYWGVTHEYVKTPEGTKYDMLEISALFIEDIGDGGAKTDKFERDIRLLTKGLEENPNNDRYTFYLANSLRDAGRIQESIDTFRKRVEIGGWIEECWHSLYSIGKCYMKLGEEEKAIAAWIEAFDYHPKRIESMYEIVNYYRLRGKNHAAYTFFLMAQKSNEIWGASTEYLFLQKDVYDYKLDYELSIIGYYVNLFKPDLLRTCMKVLAYPHLPDSTATNVLSNYKFYSKRIAQLHTSTLTSQQLTMLERATESLKITEDGEFVKSTPSMVLRGNHLIVNVRYVNYRIDSNGNYVNQEHITTRNAIAILDISKPFWTITQEFELSYDTSKDGRYVGLEDIRMYIDNTDIMYNANRGMPDGSMTVEHGMISCSKESTAQSKWLSVKDNYRSIEKNWVLCPNKKMIYHWNPKITVGNIEGDQFIKTSETPVPYFFKYLRGSTNGILIQNELWLICHVVSYEDRRYYYHIVVVLDPDTYVLKRYTPLFTFEGAHVEYTLGFTYLENNDSMLIGYSVYDSSCKYIQLPRNVFEDDMIQYE
jgi:glycosyltransferase involved in cell wall biosynthesis